MHFVHAVFNINWEVIYFAYGLVFFVLGLVIALQSRRFSRLDLAHSLNWLAAFGFVHAFNEWGDLFIPIQATYLNSHVIQALYVGQLLILAVSFALLFEFGVVLLEPLGAARWLHSIPAVILAVWIFVVYFPLASIIPDFNTWHSITSASARYFIGFPGGLVAAFGLRRNTIKTIGPLHMPSIYNMLRHSGWFLALYALFGGLIPSPAPFFPANTLNTITFETLFFLPPQVFRSLLGLGMVITMIRALEVFDLETSRMIEAMEQKQILTNERERLARELHDGAIQKVYTAGLLVQSAGRLVEGEQSVLHERLDKAVTVIDDAISDLRQNLVELHSLAEGKPFLQALQSLVRDPRFQSLVDIDLEMNLPECETLVPARSEHVLAIVNEALSNVVRHSRATHATISMNCKDICFELVIEDNGTSIPKDFKAGYGLRNMHDRARLLGGTLEITGAAPKSHKGTKVRLVIPWKEDR